MDRKIKLAISTCPNDTFAFHGLLTNRVDTRGLDFSIELLDIQQLNDGLFAGKFDVAKASFHAALLLAGDTVVLPSGSALGFGVGPLLLAAETETCPATLGNSLTLCPGTHTTATMLFRLFYGDQPQVEHRVFSEIMPDLIKRRADFGVCIHEGRFTWQEQGLFLVEDLGTRWEAATQTPLPLGGILASRKLELATIATVQAIIKDSLKIALADPESALPTMRQHAQEFDDEVLMKHVQLYVNDWTVDLGPTGEAALKELSRRARSVGLIQQNAAEIQLFKA